MRIFPSSSFFLGWHLSSSRLEQPRGCIEKLKVLVTQSCLTVCDPMDCSPPSSFVHRIFQAKVLRLGCYSLLLQKIFPTQGLIPDLLHCRQILYHLSHQGCPVAAVRSSYSACKHSDQRWIQVDGALFTQFGEPFFSFLAMLYGMQGLSYLTRDQTHAVCFGSMEWVLTTGQPGKSLESFFKNNCE